MVQRVQLVFNWNACTFKVGNGTDNVTILHVASRVVVPANDKNPRVPPTRGLNEKMKDAEVVVISGQENKRLLSGVQQVF